MDKIKTREQLCEFIMALPGDWEPTKCIVWAVPEIVGFSQECSVQEIRWHVEIRLDGLRQLRDLPRA